jgi:hypothetical protein
MSRSPEKGRNEFTELAKRQALRTGRSVAEILEEMLVAAKKAKDKQQQLRIVQAQKYLWERNRNKRRGRP